jgi:tRNA(fMet)-specific endonuclease VapC
MIADTSFIIDIMNKDEGAEKKLHELIKKGETQKVTSLTIFELYSGVIRSKKSEQEKEKILNTLKEQFILHLDESAAEKAGEIDGGLVKEGNRVGIIDTLIGGIVLTKKEKVLTRNIKDFKKIKNLEVESY